MFFFLKLGYEEVRKRVDGKAPLSECIKINKSLYALHNVASAINGDKTYIPYRETKLTRLLQDFLCRTNNAVLITCLVSTYFLSLVHKSVNVWINSSLTPTQLRQSPSLCPQTFPVISLASRSCQFVNRQRLGLASSSKECRRYVPSNPSVGGNYPLDKKTIKQGIYQLGSSRRRIKESISTTNGRYDLWISVEFSWNICFLLIISVI